MTLKEAQERAGDRATNRTGERIKLSNGRWATIIIFFCQMVGWCNGYVHLDGEPLNKSVYRKWECK